MLQGFTTKYLASVFGGHGKIIEWPACMFSRFKSYRKSLKHPEEENLLLWKAIHLVQECPLGCHFDRCKDISSDEIESWKSSTDRRLFSLINKNDCHMNYQVNCTTKAN